MRDNERIAAVLAALGAFWLQHPDLRLGQLIQGAFDAANTASATRTHAAILLPNSGLWNAEDETILLGLRQLQKNFGRHP